MSAAGVGEDERNSMKARNIMIQGTMSDVGKSLFTAGLLRVLSQDGYRAAPFKSQNMALNSYITAQGLEMSRAQVMQAEAAGIDPDVTMNPILLKPNSDMGSQVIVNGEVFGNLTAAQYFRRKHEFVPDIKAAYHKLEHDYEILVIEGAGSPAEINLKQNDIVNMGLAQMIDAPVLLIGDIDRGGVFAQLYGTVALLEAQERARIKGFIMNKFRGDRRLLEPGLQMLYERCPIPVVGVIPYTELDIEDEDSLSRRLLPGSVRDRIDIAVIRFPHIANFTDLNPLERISHVSLRYISDCRELGCPDLIILPGTKNTMRDLQWMRENGIETEVRRLVGSDLSLLLGICGGFQMMGEELADPYGVEAGGISRGLGYFPLRTIFGTEKVRRRVRGTILTQCSASGSRSVWERLAGSTFLGYEMHMGTSDSVGGAQPRRLMELTDEDSGSENSRHRRRADRITGGGNHMDGCISGNCIGTYVHGLFTSGTLRDNLLDLLFERRGLTRDAAGQTDYLTYKNSQYDRLADVIRKHTDLKAIYRMIGLE